MRRYFSWVVESKGNFWTKGVPWYLLFHVRCPIFEQVYVVSSILLYFLPCWWSQQLPKTILVGSRQLWSVPVCSKFGLWFTFYSDRSKVVSLASTHKLSPRLHSNPQERSDLVCTWLMAPYNQEYHSCLLSYWVWQVELCPDRWYEDSPCHQRLNFKVWYLYG